MKMRLPPITSSERVAYLLLAVIVVLVLLFRVVYSEWVQPSLWGVFAVGSDTIPPRDSLLYTSSPRYMGGQFTENYELFPFDPNRADSSVLRQLGLTPFVVRNIYRYRAKGGVFRTRSSFAKLYGLKSEKYEELAPYLLLPDSVKSTPYKEVMDEIRNTYTPKLNAGEVIEINAADTALLKRVPGIGRGYAVMIVRYRRVLGGFCAVEQLYDIKQIPDTVVKRALPYLCVEKDSVKPINLSIASIERMQAHPYLNFYQAKVIYEYRKKRGRLSGFSQLRLYEEFTESDFIRLAPYVRFE